MCPVGIATQDSELRSRFDIDKSSKMLHNLFSVYRDELKDFVRILWKTDVHDLDYKDLVSLNSEITEYTNIRHA